MKTENTSASIPGKRMFLRAATATGLAAFALALGVGAFAPAAASAHAGGDAGGCALQGAWLHDISRDPAPYGVEYGVPGGARNLGDIASFVAPHGYLAWFIENVEHVAFC